MPIFKKKKNDMPQETVNIPEKNLNDIQINDFSEDIDLSGLENLPGGGIPTADYSSDTEQIPIDPVSSERDKAGLSDAFGTLFKAIGGKFRRKKKRGDIPDLPGANEEHDPNYISETVSFVDSGQESEDWGTNNAESSGLPQNQPDNAMNYGGFNDYRTYSSVENQFPSADCGIYAPQPTEMPITYDVYSQPQQNLPQDFPNGIPQFPSSDEPENVQSHEESVNPANPEIFAPQWPDFDDYSLPQDFTPHNNDNSDDTQTAQPIQNAEESEKETVRRPHDIMGAVMARIEQFRRCLPSFKPKVYEVPQARYNEKEDKLAKSPSLMADVERYISHQGDLREVSQEYEQMRQYIQSVSTDTRLRPGDITPPGNIHEVYSAQNELFDMINSIGMQNEEQRRRIGVYAPPEAQDPYNYRGINDARLNYTDIESTSFSMSSGINFESEEKISPDRSMRIRQYDSMPMEDVSMDDDFGFDDGMYYTDVNDNFSDDFDNDFDSDFDNDFDNNFGGGFDDDFDNDFDEKSDGTSHARPKY